MEIALIYLSGYVVAYFVSKAMFPKSEWTVAMRTRSLLFAFASWLWVIVISVTKIIDHIKLGLVSKKTSKW